MNAKQALEGVRECRVEIETRRWGPPTRVNRGGAWFHFASTAGEADTHTSDKTVSHHFKGIRLVKDTK